MCPTKVLNRFDTISSALKSYENEDFDINAVKLPKDTVLHGAAFSTLLFVVIISFISK